MQSLEQVQPIETNNRGEQGAGIGAAFNLGKEDFDIVKNLRTDDVGTTTSSDPSHLPRLAIEQLSANLVNNEKARENFSLDIASPMLFASGGVCVDVNIPNIHGIFC